MNIVNDSGIVDIKEFVLTPININSDLYCSDPCYDFTEDNSYKAITGVYNVKAGLFKGDCDVLDKLYDIETIKFQSHIRQLMIDENSAYAVSSFGHIRYKWREIEGDLSLDSIKNFAKSNCKFPEYLPTFNNIIELASKYITPLYGKFPSYRYSQDKWVANFLKDSFDIYDYQIASIAEISDNKLYSKKIENRINRNIEKIQNYLDSEASYRTLYLHIKHESVIEYSSIKSDKWVLLDTLSVDSGQLTFMDSDFYKSCGQEDYFERLNNVAMEHKVGIGPNSATIHTAYGDGGYNVYAIKDENGFIIEALYHFMIEDTE